MLSRRAARSCSRQRFVGLSPPVSRRWRKIEEPHDAFTRRQRTCYSHRAGHGDGRGHAAVLDPGLSVARTGRARRRPGARAAVGREARGVPRHRGPGRARRRVLPASPRLLVVRPQRGIGSALRLSRLEIRRRRQLHRADERARAVLPQGAPDRLSDGRDGRGHLDLYGAARKDAAAARLRMDPGARNPPPCLEGVGGVQLAAGARRRHRHLACADPAPHDHAQHHPAGDPGAGSVRPRQGADTRSRRHRLRLSLCRHPPARRRPDLCPLLPFRHAVHADPAAAIGPRDGRRRPTDDRRPHLGPDRRRELHGVELDVQFRRGGA